MSTLEKPFTSYPKEPSAEGALGSVEDAEGVYDSVSRSLDQLRAKSDIDSLKTAAGVKYYLTASEEVLRRDVPERPHDSLELAVAAGHQLQRSRAIGVYLDGNNTMSEKQRGEAINMRVELGAESQQQMVTLLLREPDEESAREAVRMYAAVGATPWEQSSKETLQKLRRGEALGSNVALKAEGLMRGVAGHTAAVRLSGHFGGNEWQAYAPSAEVDGRHGIDFGMHKIPPAEDKITMVVQAKGKANLGQSVSITPVAGDSRDRYRTSYRRDDLPTLSSDERPIAEREIALSALDKGTARLREERHSHVVNRQKLIGLLVELQSSQRGMSLEEVKSAKQGMFDIESGLCNGRLLADARREYERVSQEVQQMQSKPRRRSSGHGLVRR